MNGAKPRRASLPRELHLQILKHVANAHSSPSSPSRGIAGYAGVFKEWLDFFESLALKNFALRLQDPIPFRVHTQSLRSTSEDDATLPWIQSRSPFATATLYLWNTLASWEVDQAGEGLTLEMSSHTLAKLIRYDNYTPNDDVSRCTPELLRPSLKKLAILHEASSTPYFARVFYRGVKGEELVSSIVQSCLLVEHLALCFTVDADEFLNNAPSFPELKTLALTAEIFLGESGDSDEAVERWMKIKTLLLLAALAACLMPKLEPMEIWNIWDGQAAGHTQDDGVVDDDIMKAWRTTASVHARDDLRNSVIRLPGGPYTYYGSVLSHLRSKQHFIHEISAAQMT
ncbi:hypothetical protein HER10_EVM0009869 [Colletotrichum scovillei]|uniref:uncharacterized protein n=1 Tax=Colletotrichum scovillei TaxID=1209932 RepID=UPI0015C2DF51|nr:uncharacterized protein HER10_EVM0009869 [Colletotrichum scovillei]KAF4773303.1 hypothetical protein HER10_EVM0009869 [Colletotrichum scovillei]